MAAMYAVANLGVLLDIADNFPELRETSAKRAEMLSSKYVAVALLNYSFTAYEEHRASLLRPPVISQSLAINGWCSWSLGEFWLGKYITEGRDYFYLKVRPGETEEDAKCRGPCDVMATVCHVRPETGSGKYCVRDSENWQRAESCFEEYRDSEVTRWSIVFRHLIGNLTELHETLRESR
mmetsp:Transcript_79378/g.219531  ORF Transcript_79378/g.219531 Transcript_79378/m.219531 type:complete len:180 (+) Transcript_79378:1102-1641(+)